ncbi:MAG: hypothetical protein H6627_12845 [Calditrichae bacterium]|nr:hypothetical protein [Calditrichia bacterium]
MLLLTSAGIVTILFLIWIVLIYMRKSLWDVVHRNLIDLEDHYKGKIIRNGFAARPVFHGKINEHDLTINFSTARSKEGRKTYIDFTLTISSPLSITIAERDWLKEQDSENPNMDSVLFINDDLAYVLLPANNRKVEKIIAKDEFRRVLKKFNNLAYFFVGRSGTICEFWTDKLDKDTEFKVMNERLNQIRMMLGVLE